MLTESMISMHMEAEIASLRSSEKDIEMMHGELECHDKE